MATCGTMLLRHAGNAACGAQRCPAAGSCSGAGRAVTVRLPWLPRGAGRRATRCEASAASDGGGEAGGGGAASTAVLERAPEIKTPADADGKAAIWELDFCSRPILDSRNKKVWELLICSPDRSFEYSEFFPNNLINSQELKKALERVLARPGVPPPQKVRFFRAQMQTIISRSCAELGLKCVPSRRCTTLMGWIDERTSSVYTRMPGFDPAAPPLMAFEPGLPQDLPDALAGDSWSFVELPLAALAAECALVQAGACFGETFSLAAAGIALPPDALVPGVAVFSSRAAALAAWTAGYDLASLAADADRATLVLDTGVSQRWKYARWAKAAAATEEARAWEAAKRAARGLHFLAVQSDAEAEACTGFWLLRDLNAA